MFSSRIHWNYSTQAMKKSVISRHADIIDKWLQVSNCDLTAYWGGGQDMLRKTRPYDSLSLEMQFSRSPIFHLLILSHWFQKYVHISTVEAQICSPHAKCVPHISEKGHSDTKEKAKGRSRQPSWQGKPNTNALLQLKVIKDMSQTVIMEAKQSSRNAWQIQDDKWEIH